MSADVMIRDASKSYKARMALSRVNLSAARGVTTILGPNGAGKTTLLRALATVSPLDAGVITVDGLDAAAPEQRREIRRRLGYLPQDMRFAERARAFDAIDYLAVMKGWRDARARRREVWLALDRVGLTDRAGDRVGDLSGGMRQRLGVAQAIFAAPPLIVLDEPTVGFDPSQRLEFRLLLSELAPRSTIVVSTHQTDDAAVCSDVVFVLHGGEVRFSGRPSELAARARNHVWTAAALDGREWLSWRLPGGGFRGVGPAPAGAVPAEPTLEEGYLLLVRRP